MPIPTPPTDNLYKFMATAGLLLIFGGIYLPIAWQDRVIDTARTFYDRTNEKLDDLAGATTDKQKQILADAITVEQGVLQSTIADRRFIFWFGVAMIVCGVYVSWRGFTWWYARYQRYQDIKVKREIEVGEAPPTEKGRDS